MCYTQVMYPWSFMSLPSLHCYFKPVRIFVADINFQTRKIWKAISNHRNIIAIEKEYTKLYPELDLKLYYYCKLADYFYRSDSQKNHIYSGCM